MDDARTAAALRLFLVSGDPAVETALRVACPPPCRIDMFSSKDLMSGQHTLSEHGHEIVRAVASADAPPDAVLVEWSFDDAPALNTLCFHVRRTLTAPVFMLCRAGQEELAAAIAAGADDALTFPVYQPYLQAKVLSYRRLVEVARESALPLGTRSAAAPLPLEHEVRTFGPLRLDRTAHRFYAHDVEMELTPREFALLAYLMRRAEALCRRDEILDEVWGINFDTGTNMVDVYMYFLRRKLEAHGLKDMIETVRGHGYRLVPPSDSAK